MHENGIGLDGMGWDGMGRDTHARARAHAHAVEGKQAGLSVH